MPRTKYTAFFIMVFITIIITLVYYINKNNNVDKYIVDSTIIESKFNIDRKLIKEFNEFSEIFKYHETINLHSYTNKDIVIGAIAHMLTFNDRTIVIGDPRMIKVSLYDEKGAHIKDIGTVGNGPGEFRGISGITKDYNDNIFILDSILRRITIMTREGNVINTFPAPAPSDKIIAERDGNFYLYFATSHPDLPVISYRNFKKGKEIKSFGSPSQHLQSIRLPVMFSGGFCIDYNNHLYVIHGLEYSIFKYKNGQLIDTFHENPSHFVKMERPRGGLSEEHLYSFTPVVPPLLCIDQLLVFALRKPAPEGHYLEIFTTDGEYLNGKIDLPDRYSLKWVDNDGYFYFTYQPSTDADGNLPNEVILVYSLNGFEINR